MATTSSTHPASRLHDLSEANVVRVSQMSQLRKRLYFARRLRCEAHNQPSLDDAFSSRFDQKPTTARLERQWRKVYCAARRYFAMFEPVLRAYLTAIAFSAGELHTVADVLDKLEQTADLLFVFGAKRELSGIASEIAPFFEAEPEDNIERGAFIEYFDALHLCMPKLQPLEAHEELEILLNAHIDREELENFPSRAPTSNFFPVDVSDSPRHSSPSVTPFVLTWEVFQAATRRVLREIAGWKMAIGAEAPNHVVVKSVLLLPDGLTGVAAINNFMNEVERACGPFPSPKEPLLSQEPVELYHGIIAAMEEIRKKQRDEHFDAHGSSSRHGSQPGASSLRQETTEWPAASSSSDTSDEESKGDSSSPTVGKKRRHDSNDESSGRKKKA